VSSQRPASGSKTFMGLSLVILGGLLFAAGVMVGRQMTLGEAEDKQTSLTKIDRRDRADLEFHEVLDQPKPDAGIKVVVESETAVSSASSDAGTAKAVEPADATGPPNATLHVDKGAKPLIEDFSGKYSLQIASYKEIEQASDLAGKLTSYGYKNIRLVKTEISGRGTYFRVRMGSYRNREEAEEAKKQIAVDRALDALVVLED
jgi:septal ring-binding cell division protein DamX